MMNYDLENPDHRAAALAEKWQETATRVHYLEAVLTLIAAPKRPDGTWNRDREAVRQLAQDALDGK